MKKCHFVTNILNELDLFGKEPEFFYKKKSKKTSYIGIILSLIYVILYIAFFIYKIIRMVKKVDIDFYETYSFIGTPSISLHNENFYAGFSIGGIIDEQIYYPVFEYWVETRSDGIKNTPFVKTLDLEICKLEKFGKKHQELFKDKPLKNFYCPKVVQEDLIGYGSLDTFSYYYIKLYPCIGTNPNGIQCKPIEEVTQFFQRTFLEFTLQDIELTPEDYDNPSYPLTKDITTPVFQGLYQSIFGYFQIVNLETNLDIFGFEAVSNNKYDKFIKYDESWIIASPSPHIAQLNPYYPVSDVTIQLAAKVLTIKRTNTKLIDVLGDVGGLMEFLWSFFNIISMFITDLLYDIDIVNNLFSFDLDKKNVLIKNVKIDERNSEEKEKEKNSIYNIENKNNPINTRNINSIGNLQYSTIKNENEINNNYNNREINIRKRSKRISKRINTTSNYLNTQNRDENYININKERLNLKQNKGFPYRLNEINNETIFSNNQILSAEEKNKSNEENSRNIIENIYINNFFVIFAFCCIRKRKNFNCFFLEEGLEILKERLDILNIFKKMYYEEQILEKYNYKRNEIEMSDNCKQKIQ